MESSIAVFLTWQSACELLPTEACCTRHDATHSPHYCITSASYTETALLYNKQAELDRNDSFCKLTWLVLGGDPAARSHRVEQFTAL